MIVLLRQARDKRRGSIEKQGHFLSAGLLYADDTEIVKEFEDGCGSQFKKLALSLNPCGASLPIKLSADFKTCHNAQRSASSFFFFLLLFVFPFLSLCGSKVDEFY